MQTTKHSNNSTCGFRNILGDVFREMLGNREQWYRRLVLLDSLAFRLANRLEMVSGRSCIDTRNGSRRRLHLQFWRCELHVCQLVDSQLGRGGLVPSFVKVSPHDYESGRDGLVYGCVSVRDRVDRRCELTAENTVTGIRSTGGGSSIPPLVFTTIACMIIIVGYNNPDSMLDERQSRSERQGLFIEWGTTNMIRIVCWSLVSVLIPR